MSADDSATPGNAEDLIERAKRQLAEKMFARMQEDDELDDRDGVEIDDSSRGSSSRIDSSSGFESGWDSGLSRSLGTNQATSNIGHTDSSTDNENTNRTVTEVRSRDGSTLDLPEEVFQGDEAAADEPRVPLFRPLKRAGMAVVVAMDDGAASGEKIRIRKTPFDVGRVEGDLLIGHDQQMSRRHFRIERHSLCETTNGSEDQWTWSLLDLESLNGVFLQQPYVAVGDGDEILFGSEVLRLSQKPGKGELTLTQVGSKSEQYTLKPGKRLLGADDDSCEPFLNTSSFLAPQHLRLECDASFSWTVFAMPGTDGVWKRTKKFPLENGVQWQVGEQRFAFFLG